MRALVLLLALLAAACSAPAPARRERADELGVSDLGSRVYVRLAPPKVRPPGWTWPERVSLRVPTRKGGGKTVALVRAELERLGITANGLYTAPLTSIQT